jgi:hypothetical protein
VAVLLSGSAPQWQCSLIVDKHFSGQFFCPTNPAAAIWEGLALSTGTILGWNLKQQCRYEVLGIKWPDWVDFGAELDFQ